MHNDPSAGTPRDPHIDVLNSDWQSHVRTSELREAEHHEALDRARASYDSDISRKQRHADMIESVELDRVESMRRLRGELDKEIVAAHELAARAFANLGLGYEPGISTVEDLYKIAPLAASDAADQAGIPISCTLNDKLLKVVKFAGMAGCLVLGTIGMGAMFFHMPARALLHSFLAVIAFGLACILVGGAYMMVNPFSRRVGAIVASQPNNAATWRVRWALGFLVSITAVMVALIDAKALMAMNSARALANPDAAQSFLVTFLGACAFSACYVMGTSFTAFNEGYALEARHRIEAAQARHVTAHRERRQNSLQVSQAVEALNAVAVIESRRNALDGEIKKAHADLRENIEETFANTSAPPEMPEKHVREILYHEQEARFAGQKLNAYEALRAKLTRSKGSRGPAEVRDGAK